MTPEKPNDPDRKPIYVGDESELDDWATAMQAGDRDPIVKPDDDGWDTPKLDAQAD